jgi:copper chaperone
MREMTTEQITYSVPGISCEHCRTAISNEVGAVAGVETVEVDLDRKLVAVLGHALVDERLRAAIDDAGYDVEGEPA